MDDFSTRLQETKTALQGARAEFYECSKLAAQARASLETREATLIFEGEIQGKNETERKAALRVTLEVEYEALRQADEDQLDARASMEWHALEWEALNRELRVLELGKGESL